MLGVSLQDGERDLAGLERHRQVALARRDRRQQRQRVERRRLVVFGKLRVELRHAIGVGAVARRLWRRRRTAARRRRDSPFRARSAPSPGAPRGSRARRAERGARLVEILVQPERLVVAERFAPVGHREAGIGLLRLAERRDRVVVLEAVKQQHAAHERRLRRGGAGGREGDAAEDGCALRLRARAPRPQRQQRPQKRKSHGDPETQSKILLRVSVSPWLNLPLLSSVPPLCPCYV